MREGQRTAEGQACEERHGACALESGSAQSQISDTSAPVALMRTDSLVCVVSRVTEKAHTLSVRKVNMRMYG